jgi:hypothetical protein
MKQKGLRVEVSATYEIRVQGSLDQKWSGRLQGLGITVKESPDRLPVTILAGRLRDQAALLGVLNALFALQLPLLFFCCLKYG